jgi:hypothetical protein
MAIMRSKLMNMAQAALDEAGADRGLRADVMNVAATVDTVTGEWWLPEQNCGCLIGTLRTRQNVRAAPYGRDVEWEVGVAFLRVLRREGYPEAVALDVTADPVDVSAEPVAVA